MFQQCFAIGADAPPPSPTPSQVPPPVASPRKVMRGRGAPKETEGSEALGRFKGDSIIRSPYKPGGQSIEVDPD